MPVLDSVISVLYYGMTAFFAFILGRNLWKTRDPQEAELASARERIARLETTIAEQAMRLHLIEGKDGWD